jgi:hypothetical protein
MKLFTNLLIKMGVALLLFYVARAIYVYLDFHLSFTQLFGLLLICVVVDKGSYFVGAIVGEMWSAARMRYPLVFWWFEQRRKKKFVI